MGGMVIYDRGQATWKPTTVKLHYVFNFLISLTARNSPISFQDAVSCKSDFECAFTIIPYALYTLFDERVMH